MLTQYDYADLAGEDYPSPAWANQGDKYDKANRYFFGGVFEETIKDTLSDRSTEPPKLYPLGINLVKMMTLTHANIFLGQWDDVVFNLRGEPKSGRTGDRLKIWAEGAEDLCTNVWLENGLNNLVLEGIISCMLYGGACYKVSPDLGLWNRIRIEHILPEYFMPRWHPMNPNDLLQVYVAFRVSVADAILAFGYRPRTEAGSVDDTVLYREYWDKGRYEVTIGEEGQVIAAGENLWGTVPFIYIPRVRPPGEFYGLAIPDDIYSIQDELNMRLADIGDRIQYTAHPVWVLKNYTGRHTNFAMGSDELIDLGTSMTGLDPDLRMIEPPGEPASTFKYIEFCIDMAKRGSMAPPIAFGEDEGSQRSSLTLNFRMWPLVQQAKLARANWTDGLERLHDLILLIRIIKDRMEGRPESDRAVESLRSARVVPKFPVLLPRERAELVTEVMDAWSRGEEPVISLETAVKQLSFTEEIEEEVALIQKLWSQRREAKIAEKEAGAQRAPGPPSE